MNSLYSYLNLILAFFLFTNLAHSLNQESSHSNQELLSEQENLVSKLLNTDRYLDGPNCFNLALHYSGVVKSLRYVQENELNFWRKSPLCRELDLSEKIKAGDIRLIINTNGNSKNSYPYHAQVYLSENKIFDKPGMGKDNKYRVIPLPPAGKVHNNKSTRDDIIRSRHCSRSKGLAEGCSSWVNVYRCQSLKEFVANLENDWGGESKFTYKRIESQLSQMELELEDVTFRRVNKTVGLDQFKEKFTSLLNELRITNVEVLVGAEEKLLLPLANTMSFDLPLKRTDEILVMSIIYRLRGIELQLMQLHYPQPEGRPPRPLDL